MEEYQSVSTDGLRVGAKLRMPLFDQRDVLLLAEGMDITEGFLENLTKRNISMIRVHREELPRIHAGEPQGTSLEVQPNHVSGRVAERNPTSDMLDQELSRPGALLLPPQGEAVVSQLVKRGATPYEERKERFVEHCEQSVESIKGVIEQLLEGKGLDVDTLSEVAEDALTDLTEDSDLFTCLGINPFSDSYPARHCLQTCMLAVAIGTQLSLDRPTLRELAIGCLMHDAGMLLIDMSRVQEERWLTQVEFLEITKHPVRIFDKIRDIQRIPMRSAFIAYQMHERIDGSGYPRARGANQIHYLSKLAAVADTYVALMTLRPYRPALLPARAIEQVVQMCNDGKFDATAVRALLRTTSQYPIGSYVRLNDGRSARVLRSNGLEFDRPVIEAWSPDNLGVEGTIIDLLAAQDYFIVGALPSLDASDDWEEYRPKTQINPELTALLDELDQAELMTEGRYRKMRVGPRYPCRKPLTAYVAEPSPDGQKRWKKVKVQTRDVSTHGTCLILDQDLPGQEVVLVLLGENAINMRAGIVRREQVNEKYWEFGLSFLERLAQPPIGGAIA